jgi:predicted ATPase
MKAASCLVPAEEAAAEQCGAEGAEWLERFAFEHDNFRAGLDWLTETGDAEWGLRLGAALFASGRRASISPKAGTGWVSC